MKRPAGRHTEGDLVLANGSVRLDRDTILPATNEKNFIAFCLYGVKFQNKVGASPASLDVSNCKMAVTPGNNATSNLARVTAPGLPCPTAFKHRLRTFSPRLRNGAG